MGPNNTAYSIGASRPIIDSSENQFRNVQVYPNPVQNTLTTDFEINNKEPISFRLLDVQGREILSDTDENLIKGRRLKELDISKVPAGVYILKIASGGSISTQKVTIQK